ncbi:hypothetical protein CDD82_7055 [Ophiocordyceps australis]|uniref:Fe2OG dioxygenase domain-containing protein n=1 Tax=Ophiocordyceps australis TaxID=1399860 RepID=A0A2C5YUD5_9HYPO|nr:hypothetical protein CDD82_7055 [Ophiocordyceps australis]
MAASPDQVASFNQNGFLIVKDFLTPDQTRDLQKWAQQVHDLEPSDTSDFMPYEEINASGQRVLCRTENFVDAHSGFNSLLRGDRLVQLVGSVSGEAMRLFKEKINYKLSGSGGFAPHIDANAYTHIAKVKHLTVLLSVDQSSQANGCLEVVAASHDMDIPLDETTRCIQDGWVKRQAWTPIELEPGQLVIFSSHLAHRSGANRSKHSRRAIYATYNCASEGDLHQEYYADRKREWPATHMRKAGERYEKGSRVYAYGSPMLSVEAGHQVAF